MRQFGAGEGLGRTRRESGDADPDRARALRRENADMNKMNFARLAFAPVVVTGLALLQLAGAGSAVAAANCIKGDRKPPYTIGWANIYSMPTWMKETTGHDRGDGRTSSRSKGLVDKPDDHRRPGQRQHADPADPVDDRRQARRDHRRSPARRPRSTASSPTPARRASPSSTSTAWSTPTT